LKRKFEKSEKLKKQDVVKKMEVYRWVVGEIKKAIENLWLGHFK
jgi:hypothetical protein